MFFAVFHICFHYIIEFEQLLVVPNEAATFLSCGDDGTVRFFDLRKKTSCSKFNCEEVSTDCVGTERGRQKKEGNESRFHDFIP